VIVQFKTKAGLVFRKLNTQESHYKPTWLLEDTGVEFEAWVVSNPKNDDQFAELIVMAPMFELAWHQGDKNVILVPKNEVDRKGWMANLSEFGLEIDASDKVAKRIGFHRLAPMHTAVTEFKMLELPADAFLSDEEKAAVEQYGDLDRLLDGMYVFRQSLREQMLHSVKFSEDEMADPIRREAIMDRLAQTQMYNFRVWGRVHWKGNATFMNDDLFTKLYGKEYHAVGLEGSQKEEVRLLNNKSYLLFEPQPWSNEVRLNDQRFVTHRKLNRQTDWAKWTNDYLAQQFKLLKEGSMLASEADALNAMSDWFQQEGLYEEAYELGVIWNAIEATRIGLDYRQFPDMVTSIWNTITRKIVHKKVRRSPEGELLPGGRLVIHPPVPCAWGAQVIPVSAARMAGWRGECEKDYIRIVKGHGWAVISDEDFLEWYIQWGTPDLDDKYELWFRTVVNPDPWIGIEDGERGVFIDRNPTAYGHGKWFKFYEGDPFPKWTEADGTEISFPEVNARNWPKPITLAKADGDVVWTWEQRPDAKAKTPGPYTPHEFLARVQGSMNVPTQPGTAINADMLWAETFQDHRPKSLTGMDGILDTFVQQGTAADRKALMEEAARKIAEVVLSGKPIDEDFWNARGYAEVDYSAYLPEGWTGEPNLQPGPITRMHRNVRQVVHDYSVTPPHNKATCQFCDKNNDRSTGGRVYKFAQKEARQFLANNPKINALGDPMLGIYGGGQGGPFVAATGASSVYRAFRFWFGEVQGARRDAARAARANREKYIPSEALTSREWAQGYEQVLRDIVAVGNAWPVTLNRQEMLSGVRVEHSDIAVYNAVIALLKATYVNPVGPARRIREGSVTNPMVWPLLVKALRFYGIVPYLPSGILNTSWELECVNCGRRATKHEPQIAQAFYMDNELCSNCVDNTSWHLVCTSCGKEGDVTSRSTVRAFVRDGRICDSCHRINQFHENWNALSVFRSWLS
jgi:hypothetical protein